MFDFDIIQKKDIYGRKKITMEMKELVYLVTLAEEESISRAAERLYMAQSSLSQFLHQFEAELGTKLFVRTSKGITPTYSGKCFIEHAGEILLDYQKAKNELWDNENLAAGKVVLGISSFRGRRMLPKVLKQFQEIYPNVKVQVVEAHSMRLEELLLDGKLDIAIIAMPVSKIKNSVEILKKDEILLAVNKEHPVTKIMHPLEDSDNYWISLKEASEYKMIMSGYDTILGSFSRKMFTEQKLKYQSDHNDISAAMAVSMAREGLGIAFTYQSCAEEYEDIRYLRIGKKGVFLDLGIAYPADEYQSKGAKELEKVIREVYNNNEYFALA